VAGLQSTLAPLDDEDVAILVELMSRMVLDVPHGGRKAGGHHPSDRGPELT